MTVETAGQVWLNRQADRIERTLSSLDLPVRVSGGQVREGGVRYHLTPMGATQAEALEGAESAVADALGAQRVRVAREIGGFAIDVTGEAESELRLLPLMHAVGKLPPLTAVLGMAAAGHPLTLSLADQTSRHLLIEGPAGGGKSELLRTMMLSLALTSRPSQLQIMAIDASGRELVCLEALPHALTDLASEPEFSLDLIEWLAEEGRRRASYATERTSLLLLVDGYDRLPESVQQAIAGALASATRLGTEANLHLIVAGRRTGLDAKDRSIARAEAGDSTGVFTFQAADRQVVADVSWLPARDLATAVRLARQHPGALDRGRLTTVLSGGY